ncbi:MAG: thioredoxin [Gammaproteobacteria bacterium]|jgi:putative thioredoxin
MSDLPNVVEVSEANFQEQVISASEQVPVLVDFWADWCAPCKVLLPILLKLAQEYAGSFRLAKVNTDIERGLAEKHGIRSLPTLQLYRHGQVVEQIMGAQPETTLRALIDAYVERESDRLLAEALTVAEGGDRDRAFALLAEAYRADPDNTRLALEYARFFLENTQPDRAEEVLEALPREVREQPETMGLQVLVQLTRSVADAPAIEALRTTVQREPGHSQARYQLASRQTLAGDYDAALENFLELLKKDPGFGDGAAKRGLLAVFALLGDDDERVTRYRRQMFALLH